MNITLTDREQTLATEIKGLIKKIRSGNLKFTKITATNQMPNNETIPNVETWVASESIIDNGNGTSMQYRYTEMPNGKLLIRTFFINDKEVKFGQIRGFIRRLDNAIKKGCKTGSRSKPKNDTAETEFFKLVDTDAVIQINEHEYVSKEEINGVPKFKLTIEVKPTPQGGTKTYRRLYQEGTLVSERAKLIYVEKAFAKKIK